MTDSRTAGEMEGKRWRRPGGGYSAGSFEPSDPKVEAFLDAIEAVCRQYNMVLSHEDGHGSFVIEDFGNGDTMNWVRGADDYRDGCGQEIAMSDGKSQTTTPPEYTRAEMRKACQDNYDAGVEAGAIAQAELTAEVARLRAAIECAAAQEGIAVRLQVTQPTSPGIWRQSTRSGGSWRTLSSCFA